MSANAGPDIVEDGIVFYYDTGNFPKGWGLTQLVPNSTFVEGGTRPTDHGCYTSGYYLGPYTSSFMTRGTLQFTGGDLSNYYLTNPEYRGWDQGSLGNTGGNWMYYAVLPPDLNSSEDYIIETRARFVYVSKTGNGSANPRFQIGRGYYERFGINYSDLGTEFKTLKFLINGGQTADANEYFTFGCTSADAMVELDYLSLYRVEKATGLKDLTGNSTVNLTNVSFSSSGEVVFDGTNDTISVPSYPAIELVDNVSIEYVYKRLSTDAILDVIANKYHSTGWELFCTVGNEFALAGRNGDGTYYATTNAAYTIENNKYYHLVAIKEGLSWRLYVNGELYAYLTAGSIGTWSNSGILQIGGEGSGYYPNMQLPVLKIYNRVLTANEIRQNYNALKTRFGI
jgi:hypothetical protein